jgi:NAD-dependent deacetylase sirtuin 4
MAAVQLLAGRRIAMVTGAGVSTRSGIPDYRGPHTRQKARTPMFGATFKQSEAARRRYWARATIGWPRIRDASVNAAHVACADAARAGGLVGLITQNVDRLHARAGQGVRPHIELHGALHDVVCLACGAVVDRDAVHDALLARNPQLCPLVGLRADVDDGGARPDGDVDVDDALADGLDVPACACGGVLKPDVVFFGENVPDAKRDASFAIVDEADALVVAGSSLEVFSGRRFVLRAHAQKKAIVFVNLGPTRVDDLATVVVDADVVDALPTLLRSCA